MAYPDNCIRGIVDQQYVIEGGTKVRSDFFDSNLGPDRGDGWAEVSVNWEDNDTVVDLTLATERPNGDIMYRGGAAVLPLEKIEIARRFPNTPHSLSYERAPLEDNKYHGNLLFKATLDRPTIRMISGMLALAVSKVVSQQSP